MQWSGLVKFQSSDRGRVLAVAELANIDVAGYPPCTASFYFDEYPQHQRMKLVPGARFTWTTSKAEDCLAF